MKFLNLFLVLLTANSALAGLTVYTDRPANRIEELGRMYKSNGGTDINVVEMKAEDIIEKLSGLDIEADVIFVKDGVYLHSLKGAGHLSRVNSTVINASVDQNLRDPDGAWTFVTTRVRALVYDSSMDVSSINSFADLANSDWAGTLCLRSGTNVYNVGLVSGLIAENGLADAIKIVSGLLNNRSEPKSYPDDTSVLKAIASGNCLFGITHSYYLGALLAQQPSLPLKIKFLNVKNSGAHINGYGAGVATRSKQKGQAQKFLEYVVSNDEAQQYISGVAFEYPVKNGLGAQTLIKDFGAYQITPTNWNDIGSKIDEARKLINELGYN